MNKIELLLNVLQRMKQLCGAVRDLANTIQNIPDRDAREELAIKLNIESFLYADIADAISDVKEITHDSFLKEAEKLLALIQCQRFYFYFSCLYAYKKIEPYALHGRKEGKEIWAKTRTIITQMNACLSDFSTLKACCQKEYDISALIISVCTNRIIHYGNVLNNRKVEGLGISHISQDYFHALRGIQGFTFLSHADLHELIAWLQAGVVSLRTTLQINHSDECVDIAEKKNPPAIAMTFFLLSGVTGLGFSGSLVGYGLGLASGVSYELGLAMISSIPAFMVSAMRAESWYDNRIANRQKEFETQLDYPSKYIAAYLCGNTNNPAELASLYKDEAKFRDICSELNALETDLSKDLTFIKNKIRDDKTAGFCSIQSLYSGAIIKNLYSKTCDAVSGEIFIKPFVLPEPKAEPVGNISSATSSAAEKGEVIKARGMRYILCTSLTPKALNALYEQTGIRVAELENLGKGNYGKLRIAYQPESNRYVGVKEMTGAKKLSEAEQESEMHRDLSELNCSALIPSLGTDFKWNERYQLTRYQIIPLAGFGDGNTLKEKLSCLPVQAQIPFISYVLQRLTIGLLTMHQHGFYHLDFKLANFVLTQTGEVWIIDFGCTRRFKNDETCLISEDVKADKTYYAPERFANYRLCQQQQNKDFSLLETAESYHPGKADIWALGIVLLELILKRHPIFTGEYANPLMRLSNWGFKFYEESVSQCFNDPVFETFEKEAPDLTSIVKTLLVIEPSKRGTLGGVRDILSTIPTFHDEQSRCAAFLDLKRQASANRTVSNSPDAFFPLGKTEEEEVVSPKESSPAPTLGKQPKYD